MLKLATTLLVLASAISNVNARGEGFLCRGTLYGHIMKFQQCVREPVNEITAIVKSDDLIWTKPYASIMIMPTNRMISFDESNAEPTLSIARKGHGALPRAFWENNNRQRYVFISELLEVRF